MLREIARCIARGVHDTIQHDGIEHAGYLAFLGLLALFPFLVFVVAVLGALGPDTATAQYLAQLLRHLPSDVIRDLEPRIMEITSGPPQSLLTIAIVGAVWTASSAVEGLRTILNRMYRVHTPPTYLFRRLLSILQLVLFTFILIVGMLLLVTLPALFSRAEVWLRLPLPSGETLWWSRLLYAGSLAVLLCVIAWIYYALPNIRQHWISVWPGAVTVVLLWMATAKLFTLSLAQFEQVTLIYGSLGGIIAALIFFYLCNMMLIFGAAFNYHVSQWAGMRVEEREHVTEDQIERELPKD